MPLREVGETGEKTTAPPGPQPFPLWATCDVRDRASLRSAVQGVDCIYYLVHSMGEGHHQGFRAVERASALNVMHAAAESGTVRRIVYLGGVEPRGVVSEHLASRLEVGEILRQGPVTAVELRAAMIVGNGSASWRILRDLALRLPLMILPRWLESRSCPIAIPDVVRALLDARLIPMPRSAWFDIPGPEVLRARELLEIVAELDGRTIPSVRVPLLSPRLSSHWLKLISGVNFGVASELVLGLQEDLLPAKGAQYWELTGHPPIWTFRSAAKFALTREARLQREANARQRAGWSRWSPRAIREHLAVVEERVVRGLGRNNPT
jgi:uncharacterized protein YbjT (DUF2867 family)